MTVVKAALLSLLVAVGLPATDDVLRGLSVRDLRFEGPGEWRRSAEPIWV
ncbi:MAG: hypothetical protein AAB225_26780 [Acidobacteriota bacterium]